MLIAFVVVSLVCAFSIGILAERYRFHKTTVVEETPCHTCKRVELMIEPYKLPHDDGRTLPVLVRKSLERARAR